MIIAREFLLILVILWNWY